MGRKMVMDDYYLEVVNLRDTCIHLVREKQQKVR